MKNSLNDRSKTSPLFSIIIEEFVNANDFHCLKLPQYTCMINIIFIKNEGNFFNELDVSAKCVWQRKVQNTKNAAVNC